MAIDTSKLNPSFGFPQITEEYGVIGGGRWYYTQNKPGTKWFDNVDNSKGWTIDFNLTVNGVVNSEAVLAEDLIKGIGIYINDGTRKETISFLTQEIIFANANQRVVYDTTLETDYRIIGKTNNLKLFGKKTEEKNYSLIANVSFLTPSTNSANGLKPSVIEDKNGDFHAVWYDDGNGMDRYITLNLLLLKKYTLM